MGWIYTWLLAIGSFVFIKFFFSKTSCIISNTISWKIETLFFSFFKQEKFVLYLQLNVYCDNQLIVGCPINIKVLADRSKVTFSSIDHCAVGMITELKVSENWLIFSIPASLFDDQCILKFDPLFQTISLRCRPYHFLLF